MKIKIKEQEVLLLPSPLSKNNQLLQRKRFKQLGISPTVENGVRTWRVIWRPFLKNPVPYQRADGTKGLRRKSRKVRTLRFSIAGNVTEESAYREALKAASLAYRAKLTNAMPVVDWEAIAKAKGEVIRYEYGKPSLNGAMDEALKLFEDGYGLGQVANQLGVSKATACRWRQRLRKEKALP